MSRGQHTLAWLANQLRVDQPAQLGSWVWRLFVYRSAATPWQPVTAGEVPDLCNGWRGTWMSRATPASGSGCCAWWSAPARPRAP
jgi:hypothetical protein